MYRLLIVDDEPIIVDGLYELFKDVKHIEFDVYKAYSGFEALEWLDRVKIDIVLSDIRMPEIDGMMLLEKIRSKWPQCKVIFLTGYNEFDYVYKAIQYSGVGYILKTERDEKIVKAVENAVFEIKESMKDEELINRAKEQMELTAPLLQKEYILDILLGGSFSPGLMQKQFDELKIQLNASVPALLILGRIDDLSKEISVTEKSKYYYAVKIKAEQYLEPMITSVHIVTEHSCMLWIMQPKEMLNVNEYKKSEYTVWNAATIFINGMMDTIQDACRESLGITVSFVLGCEPVEWNSVYYKFLHLKSLLKYRIGNGTEMLLTEENFGLAESEYCDIKCGEKELYLKKLEKLEAFLENGKKEDFLHVLSEIKLFFSGITSMHYNPAIEIYYSVALKFLSFVNRNNLIEKIAFKTSLGKLMHSEENDSWNEAFDYLRQLTDILFEIQDYERENKTVEVVNRIKLYIQENLHDDLSLVRIAEHVYFNPSYLSRFFKQATGENLSDYIMNARILKAKELLEENNLKICEIASTVGYESHAYFDRLFRKALGKTPQEYRDSFLFSKQKSKR